ncbi:MAG TPA: helix-turn-helix transcriptional regulator [Acidimicrobiales bacterium]|nr:helix-turn-helix transcriptional regulator [Acidimicrobiales bacterium]
MAQDGGADGPPGGRDARRDGLSELGNFIRQQRSVASLSLRRLSELAGISNPYLSQIERGLRTPSAQILQQLARGLRISAETLYVQAGILENRSPEDDLEARILADPHLDEAQRQALVRVYRSFRRERDRDDRVGEGSRDAGPAGPAGAPATPPAGAPATPPGSAAAAARTD